MANGIFLEIAGVRIAVLCAETPIHMDHDAAYEEFLLGQPPDSGAADMTIYLEPGEMPDVGGMDRVFDSEQSWSLFRSNGSLLLSINPPATAGKPALVARFRQDLREATVYCDRALFIRKEDVTSVANPVRYPLDQILLMYFLAPRSGAILHAAGVRVDHKCFIFPGRSGAGKSTISRLLRGMRRSMDVISDDRVIVRKTDEGYSAFGTPWPGEGGFALNRGFPLSGIFFLSKSEANSVEKIGPQKALELLLPVVSIPWFDRDLMEPVLKFCGDLISDIPSYLFHFAPDEGAVKVFGELVNG